MMKVENEESYMNGLCPVFATFMIDQFPELELRFYNTHDQLGHHVLIYYQDYGIADVRGKTSLDDLLSYFDHEHGWISDSYELTDVEPDSFDNIFEEANYVFQMYYNASLDEIREMEEYKKLQNMMTRKVYTSLYIYQVEDAVFD